MWAKSVSQVMIQLLNYSLVLFLLGVCSSLGFFETLTLIRVSKKYRIPSLPRPAPLKPPPPSLWLDAGRALRVCGLRMTEQPPSVVVGLVNAAVSFGFPRL